MSKAIKTYIDDPKVLKVGDLIRCCLDGEDVRYESDDDGEETDNEDWFTGRIIYIEPHRNGVYNLRIKRDWHDNSDSWFISLNEDNLEFIQLLIKEWDD